MSTPKYRLASAGALLSLALVTGPAWSAPPLSGAIFTTDANGAIVNGNTKYLSKCGLTGVWLDGGPPENAPATAAGLPDGDYYFQVTDPSGKKLLSTDPVKNRCVTVEGGIITKNCESGPPGPGTHVLRPSVDAGGGVVVELCPYLDTPNNGGVYKAWITPVGDYVGNINNVDNPCTNGCFHGFVAAASKTDNFKVKDVRTFCINTHKDFLDDKGDLVPGVNWLISITDSLGVSNDYATDASGNVSVCGLVPGFYTVEETQKAGTTVIATVVNGVPISPTTTVVVQLKNGLKDDTATVEFTNEDCGDKCP